MIRSETWKVAFDALRSNKLRAFLTTLGVIIGSASIVLVVTVAQTGRRYIIGQIESVGSNLISAMPVLTPQKATALSYQITLGDMAAIRAGIPRVKEVAGARELPMTIVVQGRVHPASILGVTDGYQAIRNLVILQGRFFDDDDMLSRNKVCLITEELAKLVFPNENPVGQYLHVENLRFTVIGVFRERVSTFGLSEIQRQTVIIPFPLMEYYTGDNIIRVLFVQTFAPDEVVPVTRAVAELLKSRHPPGALFEVQNLTAILDVARKISLALMVVLLLIAFIALLISGIGIMNIMLVTVTQRTREIGIRRAIGALRSEILYQFLLEAFIISGVGAVIGILIGVSIPVLVSPLLPGNLRVPVSWIAVVVAFGVSCLTGMFFGYLPANKAARLQPTESLRYE